MKTYVVDVCVAVKWFVPENYSDKAATLLNGSDSLLAPDYLLPEAGNVFWKKFVSKKLAWKKGSRLSQQSKMRLSSYIDSKLLLQNAFDLANQAGRSIHDCFYLALAIQENCQMVSFDEKFFNALQNTAWATSLTWIENL